MRIVRHDSFNAFVVDGRNVFINTGTLTQAKTPNEVIGVIAHETGHIMGGHMAQLRSRIARDATKSLLLTILGIGLMVGGAVAGGDTAREVAGAGGGLAMGGNDMVMRSLLSERRAQESAADQAGLRLLEATQQSGRGMLETFERFAEQEFWQAKDLDPFVRSHPVAADRLNQLRERVAASPYVDDQGPARAAAAPRHDARQARRPHARPAAGVQPLPGERQQPAGALCARHRPQLLGQLRSGAARGRRADPRKPDNAYFWELKGELLLKAGQHAEAIAPLRKAAGLLEKLKRANPTVSDSQTQIMLGRALVATNDPRYLDEAIAILTNVLGADKPLWQGEDDDWMGWYQLAVAYQRKGNEAEALLATARKHFYSGNAKDIREAQIYAKRAQAKFARGSRGWLIAEDIITYKIPDLSQLAMPRQRQTGDQRKECSMPAKPSASLLDALTSLKGAALLVPAILLARRHAGRRADSAAIAVGAARAPAATPAPACPAAARQPPKRRALARQRVHAGPAQGAREPSSRTSCSTIPRSCWRCRTRSKPRWTRSRPSAWPSPSRSNAGELYPPGRLAHRRQRQGRRAGRSSSSTTTAATARRRFSDVAKLIDKDKKVRVILKEFPILAKGSEEASRVALAAKMQGKYWEFHRAMLESQGQANEAAALRVAEKLGLDMARLKKDMASPEVKKEIDDTRQLATKMGIQGTPHFIVGDRIIPGAPENLTELLGKHVAEVRKDGCKVC